MQEGENERQLTFPRWDVGLIGEILDDRGKAAVAFIQQNTREVIKSVYDPDTFKLQVGEDRFHADDAQQGLRFLSGSSVVLETSTLGFVEILLLAKTLWAMKVDRISFLYVEPENYALSNPAMRRSYLLSKRDFELSEEVPNYKPIPGATRILTDRTGQRTVFFLGYEERRLDRALEDNQMVQPSNCSVVFGVPAFRPGWEMDAFANNIRIIGERRLRGGIQFCGAENPAAAFNVLEKIRRSVSSKETLVIGPIGTKPMGIGAALFATVHPDVGILYDHPKRSKYRTNSVARWHLYNVEP
jgi:hypothetical protein